MSGDGTLAIPESVTMCTPRGRVAGQVVRYALGTGPGWLEPGAALAGDRLVIIFIDGRAVYRVGGYHPGTDEYDIEWPD